MLKVGIIGCGYWGPNLVRNFFQHEGTTVSHVCDLSQDRLNHISSIYPSITATTDHTTILADPTVDAIAIATPVASHHKLVLDALHAGKHVFVEKPICLNEEEARELVEEAERLGLTLMVDHTFIFTGAVREIKNILDSGDLGDVWYYDSRRVNLGLFQEDVDVIWDLAVHDLAIMDYLFDKQPVAASATGMGHVLGNQENMAFLTLFYPDNFIAHINVNWLSPVKVRRTLIGGSKKMIVFDDMDLSEKVKVYDKGVDLTSTEDVHKAKISYRTGDIWSPQLDRTEALRLEVDHFLDCIENNKKPMNDGESGLRIVSILNAATKSMQQRGTPVDIKY